MLREKATKDTETDNNKGTNDMFGTKQKDVKDVARERAMAMLKAAGCKYIIVTEDNTEYTYGDLHIEVVKKRRVQRHFPYGSLKNHYAPFISLIEPGEKITVPFSSFPPEDLRSAISAWCVKKFGKQSTITHIVESGVEVLRIV